MSKAPLLHRGNTGGFGFDKGDIIVMVTVEEDKSFPVGKRPCAIEIIDDVVPDAHEFRMIHYVCVWLPLDTRERKLLVGRVSSIGCSWYEREDYYILKRGTEAHRHLVGKMLAASMAGRVESAGAIKGRVETFTKALTAIVTPSNKEDVV